MTRRRTPASLLTAVALLLLFALLGGCSSPFTMVGFLDDKPEGGDEDRPLGDPAPSGSVLQDDDFESATPGTIANSVGYMSLSSGSTSAEVAFWFGDNVMALSDTDAAGETYARAMFLPFVTTEATVEYEVAQISGRLWSYLELWDSNFDVIVALYLDDSGGLYYTDPGGTNHLMAFLSADTLTSARIEIDVATQTFDLHFDGSLIQADLAFSNPGVDVAMIEFRTSTPDSGGALLFDDVHIVSFD